MDDELLKKLELLNSLWDRLKVMPEMIKLAHEIVMAEFNLESEYISPFDAEYQIDRVIEAIQESLTKFVVALMTEGYNVRVDAGVVRNHIGDFDAVEIARFIEREYLVRADELAYEEILNEARRLLPFYVRMEGGENLV